MSDEGEITRWLHEAAAGRDGALDRVVDLVYADLERLARKHMKRQFGAAMPALSLEPGHLVSDTWLRLIRQRARFDNRGHFFAVATRVMLRVLLDYHRARSAKKRGGDLERVPLTDVRASRDPAPVELRDLVDALEELDGLDPRKADVVKLHVVWGQTLREIADSLDVSLATIERDWRFARAWITSRVRGG